MSWNNEKNFQYFLKMPIIKVSGDSTGVRLAICFDVLWRKHNDKTWIFLILTEDTLINRSPEHYTYQKAT